MTISYGEDSGIANLRRIRWVVGPSERRDAAGRHPASQMDETSPFGGH